MTETHYTTCTSCGKVTEYTNKRSWYNATAKLRKTGILRCPPCAGKEGRDASDVKITGRPKGVKNKDNTKIKEAASKSTKRYKFVNTPETSRNSVAKRLGYETYEEYEATLSDWEKYKNEVMRITNSQPLWLLENHDKRGPSGVEGAYQVDHIYSKYKGFKNGVPASIIGHIDNLVMLPWKENRDKGIN